MTLKGALEHPEKGVRDLGGGNASASARRRPWVVMGVAMCGLMLVRALASSVWCYLSLRSSVREVAATQG